MWSSFPNGRGELGCQLRPIDRNTVSSTSLEATAIRLPRAITVGDLHEKSNVSHVLLLTHRHPDLTMRGFQLQHAVEFL